jgi:death-on-curing protein
MNEPHWITKDILLAVHAELLNRFGGLSGIRDEGLLDSALNRPKYLVYYGSPTLFQVAASYSHEIVKNHPFLDGNKRTGFMSAYIFLGVNGWSLEAPEEEAVLEALALAAGETSEEAYATWLERTSVPAN